MDIEKAEVGVSPEKPDKVAAEAGSSPETAGAEAPGGGGWRRFVVVVSTLLGVLVIMGGLAAIATPKFGSARKRANQRACFANQKTLAGAIEMYQLDHETHVSDLAAVGGPLVSEGYMLYLPDDPGQGGGTFDHPHPGGSFSEVGCVVHGSIMSPAPGPAEGVPEDALAQLAADAGIAAASFLYLLAMFTPLELAYPARPGQAFFRPRWATDLAFFLGQYLLWLGLVLALMSELTPWLHGLLPPGVRRAFGAQPRLLQLAEVVLLGDVCIYWAHRLQHRMDFLWRFHAVHHSAEHLDWLAAHREHPLDTIYSMAIMNLPASLLGLGPEAMAGFLAFRGLWAIFIHSNVRVELGPLGLLVGSPAFHHWHHSRDRHACNYGNVSPLMDVLFGTHYDPGHEPAELGLEEPMGEGYLELLVRPLLPRMTR